MTDEARVIIKRPDLGEDAKNEVTADALETQLIWDVMTHENVTTRTAMFLSKILNVNGGKQSVKWYGQLRPSLFTQFRDAFTQLIPFEDRQYTGIFTVEEERELRKRQSELAEGASNSPKG